MAGRDGKGEKFSPGSRKQDRTIDDALRTMERLATWLSTAEEQDIWRQCDDPLQVAMLHGMLTHLRQQIDGMLAQGGDEVEATVKALRALAASSVGAASSRDPSSREPLTTPEPTSEPEPTP